VALAGEASFIVTLQTQNYLNFYWRLNRAFTLFAKSASAFVIFFESEAITAGVLKNTRSLKLSLIILAP
jgi:hypothetical protein